MQTAPAHIAFLSFSPRSGSTFLADLLNRHPAILVAPEANFAHRLLIAWEREGWEKYSTEKRLDAILAVLEADAKFHTWGLSMEQVARRLSECPPPPRAGEVVQAILQAYRDERQPEKSLVIYKKGGWYARNIPVLLRHFPSARFIHIVRDGRAVYSSARRAIHSTKGKPLAGDPGRHAREWADTVGAVRTLRGAEYLVVVRYEHLIQATDEAIQPVLRHLRQDASREILDEMMKPRRSDYVVQEQAHLHGNVGKLPLSSRINAWETELTPRDVRRFEREAWKELVEQGYEPKYPVGLFTRLQSTGAARLARRTLSRLR